MIRQASRGLLSRGLAALDMSSTSLEAPLSIVSTRQFNTSAPAHGIHIEEEVYNRQRNTINLGNRVLDFAMGVWVSPSAVVIGDVDISENVSIWHNCVLRGDLNAIRIGHYSNVQDRTVIHAARSSPTGLPAATKIGRFVTIGQSCLIRSAVIEHECIIGDKCILLEGSMVERYSILLPGSVLPPGKRVPNGQVWGGNPARFVRETTKDEKLAMDPFAMSMLGRYKDVEQEWLPFGQSSAWREAEKLRAMLKEESALRQQNDLNVLLPAIEAWEKGEMDEEEEYTITEKVHTK